MFARRRCLGAILLVLLARPASGQPRKDRLADSVDRALVFLVSQQEKDGAWTQHGNKHVAITSLAAMAFLAAGHVPGEGPHQANVEKSIRWVVDQQQPSGLIAREPSWEEMY